MQLGEVVDFCIAYNKRQEQAEDAAESEQGTERPSKPQNVKVRYATQEEISAYWS